MKALAEPQEVRSLNKEAGFRSELRETLARQRPHGFDKDWKVAYWFLIVKVIVCVLENKEEHKMQNRIRMYFHLPGWNCFCPLSCPCVWVLVCRCVGAHGCRTRCQQAWSSPQSLPPGYGVNVVFPASCCPRRLLPRHLVSKINTDMHILHKALYCSD